MGFCIKFKVTKIDWKMPQQCSYNKNSFLQTFCLTDQKIKCHIVNKTKKISRKECNKSFCGWIPRDNQIMNPVTLWVTFVLKKCQVTENLRVTYAVCQIPPKYKLNSVLLKKVISNEKSNE